MEMNGYIRSGLLVLAALAGAAARGQALESRPPLPPEEAELADLAAEGAAKEKAWAAQYRERRSALLASPTWRGLSRERRKAILDWLAAELEARKAGWRAESAARRTVIRKDSDLKALTHSEKIRLWSLRARLQHDKSVLREEYAFGRAALIKELESRVWSESDKTAELRELEAKRKELELRLEDEFWYRRRASMPDAGASAGGSSGTGGRYENDDGRFQEPGRRRDVL